VLEPVQVTGQLLRDITLAARGQTNHHDDQLGTDITLGDSAIRRDLGLGQAGDIQSRRSDTAGSSSGLFLAQTTRRFILAQVRQAQCKATRSVTFRGTQTSFRTRLKHNRGNRTEHKTRGAYRCRSGF
jgi:hypothetical protein